MRLLGIGLLAAALLLLLVADGKKHFKHSHNPDNDNQQGKSNGKESEGADADVYGPRQIAPEFGVSGREYRFRFDSQTASSYASWISTQRAMSRFQALVNVQFVSAKEAVMRLSECLAGQLNAKPVVDPWNPARIQPIEAFESNAKFQHEELERPVRFSYEQGAIEKIRFHPDEPAWSKNVKKAVLNLLQVQLAKDVVAAQRDPAEKKIDRELRQQTGTIGGKAQQRQSQQQAGQYQLLQKSFTLLEMTIEGECECTYSMVPLDADLVNVTKSVNFDRCQVLADTAFGMQADEEGKQRGEQKQTVDELRQHREDRLATAARSDNGNDPEWRNRSAGPMIAQQILDRSTTIRYVLTNQQKQQTKKNADEPGLDLFGIQHVELISQYSLKASDAESSQAMQTVATAQLHFLGSTKGEERKKKNSGEEEAIYEEEGESLMYNADMESQEKCFYMFGDDTSDDRQCPHQQEKFGKTRNGETTPYPFNYPNAQVKVSRAVQLLQLVAQAQKQQGNAQKEEEKRAMNTAENLDELITIVRFCTEKELAQIQEKLVAEGSSQAQQFFADSLAAAGTRNTLKMLLKRIEAGEFADLRAAQLIKIFSRGSGLPAPSDKIVDLLLALCKTSRVQQSGVLKQACWLSFGAILGELNQQQRIVRHSPVRTPISQYEAYPAHKMELYTKALLEQFKKTPEGKTMGEQIHEKVLALKAIGNAALDSVPKELVDSIRAEGEEGRKGMGADVIRANAIEALRRIPSQKVQKVLVPIYMDQQETPMIRTTALSVLLQSQLSPSQPMLDQIAYSMTQEKCVQVLSFTQTALQELARSPAKRHRKIAEHVKAALRLAGVDERQLEEKCRGAASKFRRSSLLFSQKEETGAFIEFAKIFPDKNGGWPGHFWVSLSSLLNGQMTEEKLRLTICQHNLDRFFQQFDGEEEEEEGEKQQEGGQSSTTPSSSSSSASVLSSAKEQLNSIWSRLKGIAKSKDDDEGEEAEEERRKRKQPALVASLRVNNVDTIMMVLIDGKKEDPMEMLKQMMAMVGARSAAEYASGDEKPAMDVNGIMFWQDRSARIPTSTGLQLNIQQKSAIFGQIQANVRQLGRAQFSLDFRPALTYLALQKMKCWTSPIHASGVKNLVAIEAHLPLKAQLTIQPQQQQIKMEFRVPQSATRFFALHTLPTTFVSETEMNNGNGHGGNSASPLSSRYHYSERVRSVENQQLVAHQFGVDKTAYQSIGLPIHVQGILHRPRSMTKLKEWAKVLFASENHYHVDFEPQPGTSPREISLTLGWDLFKLHPNTAGATMQSKMRQFMDKFAKTDEEMGAGGEEGEEGQSTVAADRHYQSAQEMVKKYAQQRAYKHTMKWTLETVGGEQNKHAQVQLESVCNAGHSACDSRVQVKCATGGPNEAADWHADGQVHALFPRPIFMEEDGDVGNYPSGARGHGEGGIMVQRQLFIGKAEVEWAARGQAEKEFIRLNIKGVPNGEMVQLFRDFIRSSHNRAAAAVNGQRSVVARAELLRLPRNAARPFVNTYHAVVEYKVAPTTIGFFQRGLELAKAQNVFNFQSRLLNIPKSTTDKQQKGQGEADEMHAFISFDPVTQQHMNVSIKTGSQQVAFQQVELPYAVNPIPLVRIIQPSSSTSVRPAKSVKQILQQQVGHQLRNRAECRVDTRREQISTFDGVQMAAPISKCWTLLAKHKGQGGDGAPEFAVLIKSMPGSQQKKLKVVTAEMGIVVIEPRENEEEGEGEEGEEAQNNANKLQVRINGQKQQGAAITSDQPQSQIPEGIEFAHSMSGNGRETVIIESEQGHVQIRFNGQTARIKLSGSEYQNAQWGLCGNWDKNGANEWESLPNGGQADSVEQYQRAYAMEDEEGEEQQGCTKSALDQFYAQQSAKFQQEKGEGNTKGDEAEESEEIAVEQQTKVIEYQHQLCFSMRPVKQCPVGSFATIAAAASADNGAAVIKQQKVPFTCLDRSSIEAKQFKRQARRGESIQLADYPASFQEMVVIPERCIKY